MNAGPWLAVPPPGYGGIEHVVATLVQELRRRGVRVTLATVGTSSVEADEVIAPFERPMFGELGATYNMVSGIPHAHMHRVVAELRERDDVDLVHDHVEVVGAAMLAAMGDGPPVLQTLHWDLGKHRDFYATFDGGGRVRFVCVSASQLAGAPPRLAAQVLRAIPLGVDLGAFAPAADHGEAIVALGRVTAVKGSDLAVHACREAGLPLLVAGPVAGVDDPRELAARLADASDPLRSFADARFWTERMAPLVDGDRVRWVGGVPAEGRAALLAGARAALFPVRWKEPGGTAAIEALASGTPVVAMRRGAFATIVEHGVTGFLADREDELPGYLRRLDELDRAACRRAAEERFSAGRMAEDYLAVYEQLAALTAPARRAAPGDGARRGPATAAVPPRAAARR